MELDALPVYDGRYLKTKIRTYGDKIYTNFCSLNVPEDGTECKSFIVISINFLLVSERKCCLQIYLDNCAYTVVDKQIVGYLDINLFEADDD